MKAWHFVSYSLRDGRDIPKNNIVLKHEGKLKPCISGLHASVRLLDALQYSPGHTICRVECGGEIIQGKDKLVCSQRTILWRVDLEDLLRDFSRWCAYQVVSQWDCPDVVKQWLETGDKKVKGEAYVAANSATNSAGHSAAYSADYSSDYSAANSAAHSASCSADYYAAETAQNIRLEKMVNQLHQGVYKKWTT